MRGSLRAPFVVTVGSVVAAGLGGCSSGPTHTMNPPGVEAPPPPPMNPPPPTGLTACPPEAPAAGTACVGSLHCHYGSTDGCDPTYVDYDCMGGTFAERPRPTCNPPPPTLEPAGS